MSNWTEFRGRCQANVQKIRDTSDDGVYAKLYAEDVQLLLDLIQQAQSDGFVPAIVFAWLKDGNLVTKR